VLDAPEGVLAFERQAPGERLLCVFELAGEGGGFAVPADTEVMATLGEAKLAGDRLKLGAFGGAILRIRQ
jgi:alpha-glucosidase